MKAQHRNKILAVIKNWQQELTEGNFEREKTDREGELINYPATKLYVEDNIDNLKSFLSTRLYKDWKDKKGGIEATKKIWADTSPLTDQEIRDLKHWNYFIKDGQRIFAEESTRPAEQLKKNPDWEKFSYTTWNQKLTGKTYIFSSANEHPLLNPDNWSTEELTKLDWYKIAELFIYWK